MLKKIVLGALVVIFGIGVPVALQFALSFFNYES